MTVIDHHTALRCNTGNYFVGNMAKGRISKRVFQENKAHQIFRETNISYSLIRTCTCTCRGKKCSFFGKFGMLCFLETPVLRFALLQYYRRFSTFALTLFTQCMSESCIKININLYFYFHTSLWCLKRFYDGL